MALNHRVVSDGLCVSHELYLHSYFHDFTVGKGDRGVAALCRFLQAAIQFRHRNAMVC
jgi:hypothetical protein